MKTEEPEILKKSNELLRHINKKCTCYEVPMSECDYLIEKMNRYEKNSQDFFIYSVVNLIVESILNIHNYISNNKQP